MEKEFDWLDSGNFAENYDGPVYATPEWVRHPERMPERNREALLRIVKELLKCFYRPMYITEQDNKIAGAKKNTF